MNRMAFDRSSAVLLALTLCSPVAGWAQGKAADKKAAAPAAAAAKELSAVLVTYENDTPYEKTVPDNKEWAKGLKKIPGLISKTWLNDGKTAGGFYLFTDKGSAEAFINGEMFQSGVVKDTSNRNVQIRYFAVNAELCALTGCPTKTLAGK